MANLTAGDGAESAVKANDAGGAIAAYSSTLGDPFAHYAGRASLFADTVTMGLDLRSDGSTGDMRFYTGGPWPANERMRITDTGNIGIGTTNPDAKLHSISTDMAKPGVFGENLSTGHGVYGKSAFVGVYGEGQRGIFAKSNSMFGIYSDAPKNYFSGNVGIGTTNPQKALDVAGWTRTEVLEITGGSDLAEPFNISLADSVEPGMVVCIDPENPGELEISRRSYDRRVAGIISGAGGINPGMIMGQNGTKADGSTPVALTGRVYCLVDASNGSIEPGDLLTTSDIPGHAMKVTDYTKAQGAIIGKAMSSLEQGQGLVLVLVTLQ